MSPRAGFATPEARVYRPARAPAIYRELAKTPADAVVVEMPLGEPDFDVRSVYYSTAHWRRLVNGYSGFFPPHYPALWSVLANAMRDEELAWRSLQELQVTHAVIHEGAYLDDEGVRLTKWLRTRGAVELFRDGRDTLLALPR
jgi:hypothetical protein